MTERPVMLLKFAEKRCLARKLASMNRTATLDALVKVTMPISEAISRLAEFRWDSDIELISLAPEDFYHILSLFKQGSIPAAEVENWANALECRDDVGVSSQLAQELLYELANPLLTQPLSSERTDFWLTRLQNGC